MSQAAKEKLSDLYQQLMTIREEMRDVQKDIDPEPIKDYELLTPDGGRKLSSFFGEKDLLYVIHNMGSSCAYCTLWADGFNGVIEHLENRAAWVLTSPDSPEEQLAFAKDRDWHFQMASLGNSSMAKDLGYEFDNGEFMPGVSLIQRQSNGALAKLADTPFGPGDPYCVVFNLFDLIPGGAADWQPQFTY